MGTLTLWHVLFVLFAVFRLVFPFVFLSAQVDASGGGAMPPSIAAHRRHLEQQAQARGDKKCRTDKMKLPPPKSCSGREVGSGGRGVVVCEARCRAAENEGSSAK